MYHIANVCAQCTKYFMSSAITLYNSLKCCMWRI